MNALVCLCTVWTIGNTQDIGTAILTFADIEAKISRYQSQITVEPFSYGRRGEVLDNDWNRGVSRRNETSQTKANNDANKELAGVHIKTSVQVAFPAQENVISLAMPTWVNAPSARVTMNGARTGSDIPVARVPFTGDWAKKMKRNDFIELEGSVTNIKMTKFAAKVSLTGLTLNEPKKNPEKK
jgi:hypothetical protein